MHHHAVLLLAVVHHVHIMTSSKMAIYRKIQCDGTENKVRDFHDQFQPFKAYILKSYFRYQEINYL